MIFREGLVLGGAVVSAALALSTLHEGKVVPAIAPMIASAAPLDLPRAARERFVGVLVSEQVVTLTAPMDGIIDRVLPRPGEAVRRGAIVAAQDTRAKKRELAIAQASLRSAEAEVARVSVEVAEARETLARRGALHAEGLASGQERVSAAFQERLAGARLEVARAGAEEARARVEQLRGAIDDAEIRAPFDGVVAARFVDPGSTVLRGAPIVRVISGGEPRVRFAVTAEVAARLAPGARVRAEVGATGAFVEGAVVTIAPEIDAAARLILIEATLRAEDVERARHLTGEAARVELPELN